jgi:hypothetical protein
MAHGLQADGIECRGERRKVVGMRKISMTMPPSGRATHKTRKRMRRSRKHASQHDERRQQRNPAKNSEASDCFERAFQEEAEAYESF